jgi:hypothetical protein
VPLPRLYFPGRSRLGIGLRALLAGGFALSLGVLGPAPAEAGSPFLVMPEPGVAEVSPAYRYANMTDEDAFAELDKRQILYSKIGPVPGVRAPIRLTGRLHGVYFRSSLPPEQRVTTIFEILDARLALALDDFAAVLAAHDIDEVVHYTMYRPNVARPGHVDHEDDDDDKPADRAPSARRRAAQKAAVEEPKQIAAAEAPKKAAAEAPKKAAATATEAPKQATAAESPKKTAAESSSNKALDTKKNQSLALKAPAIGPRSAELGRKATLSGKGSLDAKKGSRQAPSTSKQKSAAAPKSAAPSAPIASPKASKAAPPPKAVSSLRSGPVASTKAPAQIPRARTSWAPPGTRHPAGLAIDVGLLRKRDGRWLSVADHFHGNIGDKTCGAGASVPQDEVARELRAILCEAEALGIFTYVLTPNYNAAHADHYHMEIKPGVRWFLYH